MLQKIVLQCRYSGENKANYNWGSLFHGFLFKALPDGVADLLHQGQLRPFSQFVTSESEQQLTWTIGLWDGLIAGHIVRSIMPLDSIQLEQKGLTLEVVSVNRSSLSVPEFFARHFTADVPCRRYEIEFLTPCTHKQDGSYVLFPTPGLIINSLSKRYSAFMQDVTLDDPQAMEQVAAHLRIVRYSLRTAVYYLENTKITGYMGRITLVINGPEQLARLAGALLSFAEYSGVGIKTALGMGGVIVRQIQPRLPDQQA